jgi:hypothetical protein
MKDVLALLGLLLVAWVILALFEAIPQAAHAIGK